LPAYLQLNFILGFTPGWRLLWKGWAEAGDFRRPCKGLYVDEVSLTRGGRGCPRRLRLSRCDRPSGRRQIHWIRTGPSSTGFSRGWPHSTARPSPV